MVVLSRASSSVMIAFISVLTLLAACPVSADEDIREENGVWILNTTNFEAAIYQHKFVLVYFYSADCDHCKELEPVLPEVATRLKADQGEVRVAQVDGPASPRLTIKFGIPSYPTIFFFRNGEQIEYTGGHSADDFISWLQKKTQSPVVELPNKEAAQAFINSSNVVVVGFFKEKNSEGAQEFLKAADDVDDVAFGVTYSPEVFVDNKVKGDTVVLFKKFDESRNVFEGKLSQEEITTFIQLNELPEVVEFTRDVVEKLFDHVVKKHLLLFVTSAIKDKFLDVYRKVSNDFKGQFLFIYVDVDNENTVQIVRYFGLDKDTVPALRLVNLGDDMKKYQPESQDIDSVVIRQFLRDFLDGNLQEVEIVHAEEEPQNVPDEKEQTTGEPTQESNEEDQLTSDQQQNDKTKEQSGLDTQQDIKETETQEEDASKEEKEDEDPKKVEASATKEKDKDAPSEEEGPSPQAKEEKVASKKEDAGKQNKDTSSQDGDSKEGKVLSRKEKGKEEEEASIQEEKTRTQDDEEEKQEKKETAIPEEESTVRENKKEKGEKQEKKETSSKNEEAITQAEEGEKGEEEEEAPTEEEGVSVQEEEEEEKDKNQEEEEEEETTPKEEEEAIQGAEKDKDENSELKETQEEEAVTQEDEEKKGEKQEKKETSSKKEEQIKEEKKISKSGREEL